MDSSNQVGVVYLLRAKSTNTFKIGYTMCPIVERINALQTNSPYKIIYVHAITTYQPLRVEKILHHMYKSERINGEWFTFTDEDVKHCIGVMNKYNELVKPPMPTSDPVIDKKQQEIIQSLIQQDIPISLIVEKVWGVKRSRHPNYKDKINIVELIKVKMNTFEIIDSLKIDD